jgi:hypothetical protein
MSGDHLFGAKRARSARERAQTMITVQPYPDSQRGLDVLAMYPCIC